MYILNLSPLHLTQQTGSTFEEQYWEKIDSPINADLNLSEITMNNYFPYSQHCHEATLALGLALHNTSQGMVQVYDRNLSFLAFPLLLRF